MKKFHTVTFHPENETLKVEDRISIFETITNSHHRNINLNFACGAEGVCQKCKVRSFKPMGPLTPTEKGCLSEEEIRKGIRLACQARVIQDTKAEIIYKMPFSIRKVEERLAAPDNVRSRIEKIHITTDNNHPLTITGFLEFLQKNTSIDITAEKVRQGIEMKFPRFFEKDITACTAVFSGDEFLCVEEGDTKTKKFAAAVDIGINTLMISLADLTEQMIVASVTDTNPQMSVGPDLESRRHMISRDSLNMDILNEEILLRIDILVSELCREMNVSPLHVYEIVVCGHTQELCFFLKNIQEIHDPGLFLDEGKSGQFSAESFLLQYPRHANIYAFPVISRDIGGDIAAGIFAAGIHLAPETELFINLGAVSTGVLSHEGKISATSVSKTGVFECVGIAFGMRPETGAIESVFMDNEVKISVIGESLPRGICGSGLLEGAAVLKRIGIIDDFGNFQNSNCRTSLSSYMQKKILDVEGEKVFLLFSDDGDFQTDIYITRQDLQLLREAKARISHMINSLITQSGVSPQAISRVVVGGVFGHKIDIEVFFELGILPSFLKGRVSFLGNTSKKGAEMALFDGNFFREAEKIVQNIRVFPPFEGTLPENLLSFSSSF